MIINIAPFFDGCCVRFLERLVALVSNGCKFQICSVVVGKTKPMLLEIILYKDIKAYNGAQLIKMELPEDLTWQMGCLRSRLLVHSTYSCHVFGNYKRKTDKQ